MPLPSLTDKYILLRHSTSTLPFNLPKPSLPGGDLDEKLHNLRQELSTQRPQEFGFISILHRTDGDQLQCCRDQSYIHPLLLQFPLQVHMLSDFSFFSSAPLIFQT
jgi:hypothetical protein